MTDKQPDIVKIVTQNIRRVRVSAGISQAELAEFTGMHRTYLCAIESGKRNITIGLLHRIATALSVQVSTLLEEHGTSQSLKSKSTGNH